MTIDFGFIKENTMIYIDIFLLSSESLFKIFTNF